MSGFKGNFFNLKFEYIKYTESPILSSRKPTPSLCLQKMASTSEIPLAENNQPLVTTTLARDNIDWLEVTFIGRGNITRLE